ncbi:DUF1540 domain-containing protein [Bacillus horti]|uniref:DUF1540 domain-containing protein n=1 Tax=Caldalkalibacillus horti TaxID=77523 RepID=A0ABT9W4E5_9BACI|nr:DUF1540 domain-containing protein [Bacillus horti]MDQ0168108.1 hypothetical protein [Bacillus horti]
MERPAVNCTVSNCTYWDEGNKCGADSILIHIDQHANEDYEVEAGKIIGEDDYEIEANSVANTCCHTFKPRS